GGGRVHSPPHLSHVDPPCATLHRRCCMICKMPRAEHVTATSVVFSPCLEVPLGRLLRSDPSDRLTGVCRKHQAGRQVRPRGRSNRSWSTVESAPCRENAACPVSWYKGSVVRWAMERLRYLARQ